MGRLMPGMLLALIAEVVLLAVTFLQNGAFDAFAVPLPSTSELMTPQALEAYVLKLLSDEMILIKLLGIIVGAAAVNFIISAPLRFGTLRWYWQAAQDKVQPVGYAINSYASFKEIGRSLWIYIYVGLHYIKWAILTFIPAIAVIAGGALVNAGGNETLAVSLVYLGVLIGVGMAVLYIYITNRFFLAPFLYAEGDISAAEACRQSKEMMKGGCGGLFVFRFSLVIVEIIATMFCYGAATIVAAPYINMCEASYAAELVFGSSEPKQEKVEYTVE